MGPTAGPGRKINVYESDGEGSRYYRHPASVRAVKGQSDD
jgi:hypothetical protein